MSKQPTYPFDLTGYTCFSIIDCPVEKAVQLSKEYSSIPNPEKCVPFLFQIAALPEETKWTLLRWPQPGPFIQLMNLTVCLMGYREGQGGETPIFVALPPAERAAEGPFLARPDYDNPLGNALLGFWQNWSFHYSIGWDWDFRWIGEDIFPQDYFFNGRGYSSTGFQLEWLEHLERITDWVECPILIEK